MNDKVRAAVEKNFSEGLEAEKVLGRISKSCESCGAGTNILAEREQQIIREMIDWYRTPTSLHNDHIATRFIARLSEVRQLKDALDYRAKKAGEARAALFGKTTAE